MSLSKNLQELSIRLLNISNDQITRLFEGHIFPYVVKLEINGEIYDHSYPTKITRLEKKMFNGFPTLQTLSVNYNKFLRKIDSDAFSSLNRLVHLNLKRNFIEKLDERSFSALSQLETLDLSENEIECLQENLFSNLKNLSKLDLSANRLSSTLNPKSFYGLRNLKELNLSCNKLAHFDMRILDNFEKIKRIYHLFTDIQSDKIEILEALKIKDIEIFF